MSSFPWRNVLVEAVELQPRGDVVVRCRGGGEDLYLHRPDVEQLIRAAAAHGDHLELIVELARRAR